MRFGLTGGRVVLVLVGLALMGRCIDARRLFWRLKRLPPYWRQRRHFIAFWSLSIIMSLDWGS